MLREGTQIGPYKVSGLIGAGGMGEVYRATDTRLRREVAIKVLPDSFASDPERRARFQREAETLATLNHAHIGAIYGMEQSGSDVCLVLEFVEGETLGERIARGALPVDEALRIGYQIAIAVEAAHAKGVVHRDLKPANVKITPAGEVKVLDFGLAKVLGGSGVSDNISNSPTMMSRTGAGVLIGTAAYMSPEQARGREATTQSDIWAFGCILFEMLSGKRVVDGESMADIMGSIVKGEPEWASLPADVSPGVQSLLKRCLQKDRLKRARDIGDIALEIEQTIAQPAVALPELPATQKSGLRSTMQWVGALTVLGMVLSLVSILSRTPPPQDTQVIRFAVNPPRRFFIRGQPTTFALSPDGRFIAFIAEDSARNLWVRALDSTEAVMVPGSIGAGSPFWSPDSKFVGFYSSSKLRKASVAGLRMETVSDISGFPRFIWSTNNIIVFGDGGVLYKVPADGGEPQRVWDPGPDTFVPLSFLPDGDHLLVAIRSSNRDATGLWVFSLKSPETRKRVLPQFLRAVYSATGHIVFWNDNAFMAQPFDAAKAEVTGEPMVIGNTPPGDRLPDVSSNGILATAGISTGLSQLVWYDRSGTKLSVALPSGVYRQIRLSPDASKAAVVVPDVESGAQDLWLLEMSSGVFSKFTSLPGNENDPSWSPDGRELAFSWRGNLFKKRLGAQDATPIFESKDPKWLHDWSRDGYAVYGAEDGAYYLNPGDTKPIPILQNHTPKDEFRISPDGKWIAYNSEESGRSEVYVATFPRHEQRRQISNAGGMIPRWRGDMHEMYYLSPDGAMMAVDVQPATDGGLQTGTPHGLFQTHIPVSTVLDLYDVTNDGRKFLLDDVVDNASSPPITIVVNWPAALKKK